jgi:hypothetical protein
MTISKGLLSETILFRKYCTYYKDTYRKLISGDRIFSVSHTGNQFADAVASSAGYYHRVTQWTIPPNKAKFKQSTPIFFNFSMSIALLFIMMHLFLRSERYKCVTTFKKIEIFSKNYFFAFYAGFVTHL